MGCSLQFSPAEEDFWEDSVGVTRRVGVYSANGRGVNPTPPGHNVRSFIYSFIYLRKPRRFSGNDVSQFSMINQGLKPEKDLPDPKEDLPSVEIYRYQSHARDVYSISIINPHQSRCPLTETPT